MNTITSHLTETFGSACCRIYCPDTPRDMFKWMQDTDFKVIFVDSDEALQEAQNNNRTVENTVFVFSFDYPAPREITSVSKKVDLKELFSANELEDHFDYWEE